VVLDEQLKRMIIEERPDAAYREYLKSIGFVSMFEDGLRKVEAGITTISEVLSVTIGSEV
jgi:type II secretory ATPase GspE/PulE/Tfp pilus assembly ATPase PilB-like protein